MPLMGHPNSKIIPTGLDRVSGLFAKDSTHIENMYSFNPLSMINTIHEWCLLCVCPDDCLNWLLVFGNLHGQRLTFSHDYLLADWHHQFSTFPNFHFLFMILVINEVHCLRWFDHKKSCRCFSSFKRNIKSQTTDVHFCVCVCVFFMKYAQICADFHLMRCNIFIWNMPTFYVFMIFFVLFIMINLNIKFLRIVSISVSWIVK